MNNQAAEMQDVEMQDADTAEMQAADTAEAAVPESVNLSDLGTLLQIVDLATQRGAFRGAELSQVGAVFDKLNAFLTYVQQQQALNAEASTDDSSVQSEETA